MSIGKITMNELSDSLKEYLQKLSGESLKLINLSFTPTDIINANGVCPIGSSVSSATLNWGFNNSSGISAFTLLMTDLSNTENQPETILSGAEGLNVILERTFTIDEDSVGHPLNMSNDYKFTFKINYVMNSVEFKTETDMFLRFRDPAFIGKCPYDDIYYTDIPDGESISKLDYYTDPTNGNFLKKTFIYDKNITFGVDLEDGNYATYLLPAENGFENQESEFYINNLKGGMGFKGTFTYTRPNGTTALYNIYRTTNANLGKCTIKVTTPTFTEGLLSN